MLGLSREWDGSWPARFPSPVLDFCLIDGGHSYRLALRDFNTTRSACRVIAFHDVRNLRLGAPSTSVVRLWKELTDPAHPLFARDFVSRECAQQPEWSDGEVMGIGMLVRATERE